MERALGAVGALIAATAVAAGAFGAHALRGVISADRLANFETAIQYAMFHAIGILVVAILRPRLAGRWAVIAGWSFVVGVVLFCGAVVSLSLGGPRWLGIVAPVGGSAFIVGWLCLATAWLIRRS